MLVRLRHTLLYDACGFSSKPRNVAGHETGDDRTTSAMQAASARTYQALFYRLLKAGRKISPFQAGGSAEKPTHKDRRKKSGATPPLLLLALLLLLPPLLLTLQKLAADEELGEPL